jgi:putative phosphoesterase
MKIGILSDSHRDIHHTEFFLNLLKEEGAEYLIHAGDFVDPKNLELLHQSNRPYASVFGNNDAHLLGLQHDYNVFAEPHFFAIKELKFKLMHLPHYLAPYDEDIIIYGHTHDITWDYCDNTLLLNPGEVCARDTGKHEAILLEVDTHSYIINHFYKYKNDKKVHHKISEIERN